MSYKNRAHPLWYAYLLHRLSGLTLVLFLPAHFYVLALVTTDPVAGQVFFHWSDMALVKIAELVLVFLLAVHFFGGLRLLALEWLPWTPRHKTLAAGAAALAVLVSGTFFLQAL